MIEKQQVDRLTALNEQLPKELEAIMVENSKYKDKNANLWRGKEDPNTKLVTSYFTMDKR